MEKIKKLVLLSLFISLLVGFFTPIIDAGIITFCIFILWILLSFIYKLSYTSSVKLGLLGLGTVVILLIIDNRNLAEKVAILSYMLFVIGFVQQLYEKTSNSI